MRTLGRGFRFLMCDRSLVPADCTRLTLLFDSNPVLGVLITSLLFPTAVRVMLIPVTITHVVTFILLIVID